MSAGSPVVCIQCCSRSTLVVCMHFDVTLSQLEGIVIDSVCCMTASAPPTRHPCVPVTKRRLNFKGCLLHVELEVCGLVVN